MRSTLNRSPRPPFLPRLDPWSPWTWLLALVVGALLLSLLITVLMIAASLAAVALAAWIGWKLVGALLRSQSRPPNVRPRAATPREARGLLEMARTADPLQRYLLAVNEFDRLAGQTLSLDPADAGRSRTARRAAALAAQATALHQSITDAERLLVTDPKAAGALPGVWELTIAASELWSWYRDVAALRTAPDLAALHALLTRRTALLTRRDALVSRLQAADFACVR